MFFKYYTNKFTNNIDSKQTSKVYIKLSSRVHMRILYLLNAFLHKSLFIIFSRLYCWTFRDHNSGYGYFHIATAWITKSRASNSFRCNTLIGKCCNWFLREWVFPVYPELFLNYLLVVVHHSELTVFLFTFK